MGITTSENSMIDLIQKNKFLKTIFPEGLGGEVFFGQISLDVDGRVLLGIHTRKKPAINVEKWGVWGDDYNVVVINVLGRTLGDIVIINHHLLGYADFSIQSDAEVFKISQVGCNFEVKFALEYLVFQNCDTYIDGAMN